MDRVDRLCLLFLLFCAVALVPTRTFAVTISYDQCLACGPSGGAALQILFTGLNPGSVAAIGFANTTTSYNPATVGNIDASVDKDATFSQAAPFTSTFASGFRPLIEQDGISYLVNPAIAGPVFGSDTTASTSFTSGWATIQCDPGNSTGCPDSQTNLTLSNFVQFSFATGTFGAGTPNLTDPIYFGLATFTSISGSNTQISNATAETDFANLSLSDGPLLADGTFSDLGNYQVFEYATPEPSTLPLIGLGLIGVCWKRRQKLSE